MGGSQVFLEVGEEQSVETMIKCIAIASANDACVAMAEFLCGSEAEFVSQMNARARELGMSHTNFVNSNGLDTEGHVTSARDVAIMSRELITKHPEIVKYSMIWMENIVHTTAKGSSEFGLTNTNKLVRQYSFTTGLKTGSTSLAKYCVSATAKKEDIELIAVVMAAPDHKVRFKDAVTLLNYGFSVCKLYQDANQDSPGTQQIKGGVIDTAELSYAGEFRYLAIADEAIEEIKKEIRIQEYGTAPVNQGDVAGEAVYLLDNREIGRIPILYAERVEKATYPDYIKITFRKMLL